MGEIRSAIALGGGCLFGFFFAYVLKCEPNYLGGPFYWYCGLAKRQSLAARLCAEFEQTKTAAQFCKDHKPLAIELVWPVAHEAAEGYIFDAIAARLSASALSAGRLGGWTQTDTRLSPCGKVTLERVRRMVTRSCLRCGEPEA